MNLEGKRVTVVGLGLSGTALVKWLTSRGALVGISEIKPDGEFTYWLRANARFLERTEFGGHTEAFLCSSDLLIVSPGISLAVPAVAAAVRRGVPVAGEMEVVLDECPARVVGVTGTNGKTTTSSLLGHILNAGGIPSTVAGNIGLPVSQVVEEVGESHVLVLEVSSFQLDTAPSFHPALAMLLNVTPDHLDRYDSFDAYVRAKDSIFANQIESDLAVLNRQDPHCSRLAGTLKSIVRWFDASSGDIEGAGVDDGWLVMCSGGRRTRLLPTTELPIRGAHNLENALAACVAAQWLGVPTSSLANGLRTFPGVPHRLETCESIGEVAFINDSKATNVDALEKALASFSEPVVLIAGGRDKGGDFTRLASLLRSSAKAVVLIGSDADKMEDAWRDVVSIHRAGSLDEAVKKGYELASPKGTVLLSPGCASFDMFRNFEDRGRRFRDAVKALAMARTRGGVAS